MSGGSCDVCGKPSIGFASSTFGAVSWAYCQECLTKPAEPLCIFDYLFDDVSDNGEGLAEHVNDFYTFIEGRYVSWPEYVKHRKSQINLSGNSEMFRGAIK